jgi:hypothetical protein
MVQPGLVGTQPSLTRPFIFISIPRCASSTVHFLLGLKGPKDCSSKLDEGIFDNHAPCSLIAERYGQEQFATRFKFTFVRNPWDRCVSWFFFHRNLQPYRDLGFRDWIKSGMPHHWQMQNGTLYGSIRSPLEQHRFVTDAAGRLMVDVVGRVESFQRDLQAIAKHIGFDLLTGLPRINRAKARVNRDYRAYYDHQTAELVGRMLARDLELFGYRFGHP